MLRYISEEVERVKAMLAARDARAATERAAACADADSARADAQAAHKALEALRAESVVSAEAKRAAEAHVAELETRLATAALQLEVHPCRLHLEWWSPCHASHMQGIKHLSCTGKLNPTTHSLLAYLTRSMQTAKAEVAEVQESARLRKDEAAKAVARLAQVRTAFALALHHILASSTCQTAQSFPDALGFCIRCRL